MAINTLSIRGAREHNLKNVSVDLPRNQLIVITGLSGSGKSSLAFDTIYAEGQRRYVESLSAYARQFLELMQKPDVDSIEGLSPAISIEQKTTSKNPRSTVGTITEIYDYLRLLYARIGVPYSPATGKPIRKQTISEMVDRILEFDGGKRFYLLAPMVRGRKGEYKKEIQDLQKKGFQRLKIDGKFFDIQEAPELDKNKKHDISVVVDRFVVKEDMGSRLADSLATALQLGEGLAIAENAETQEEVLFSEKFACPVSGFCLEEVEPRLFSFNSPYGACPTCDGLGVKLVFDESLVVPNGHLSLREGAIEPWFGPYGDYAMQILESVAAHYKISVNTPFEQIPPAIQKVFLHGSGTEMISITYEFGRTHTKKKVFEGVIPNLQRRWKETDSDRVREDLSKYQTSQPCEACHGYRLKPEALSVKIHHLHIGQVCDLSIEDSAQWFETLDQHLSEKEKTIAIRILKEIRDRLHFLKSVGLDYLTLSRMSGTLSGGESQRIRLASQIGSGLTGVLYVLDEPSIGLHQRDNDRLLVTLRHLRDLGNTVIVVEHDEDAIRQADYLVDMGPGAGNLGGHIIAEGTPQEVMDNPASVTGKYLKGILKIDVPKTRRQGHEGKYLRLTGATANNLKNVSVEFPLGKFICVTGVSGGGKSSLVNETLYKALFKILHNSRIQPGAYKDLTGFQYIDKVIDIDQAPIGRTPRSNPATYTGVFTPIREWFAKLPEAKARGYSVGRFSFNVKGGRCEACQGDGVLKIEMHFLPDVYVTCDHCKGKRYNRETLDIKFKNKSIADVLEMTVDEGLEFFDSVPFIRDKLETLKKVGLGYIHIGQRATTLSGGEAQRIKLSKELSKRPTGKTLYILDEPTTGLHFEDIRKLLEVLHTFADQGNTLIIIEHNLEVIKTADWIIDMGPEGGNKGGKILGCGTPEDIARLKTSYTGQFLKPYLKT
ncbi:MAG: excinuclease ABC subunit UvrA [Alphaproteobacteria bacterium]